MDQKPLHQQRVRLIESGITALQRSYGLARLYRPWVLKFAVSIVIRAKRLVRRIKKNFATRGRLRVSFKRSDSQVIFAMRSVVKC